MKPNKLCFVLFFLLCFNLTRACSTGMAYENVAFDDDLDYDIYLQVDEKNILIIETVNIIGIKKLDEKIFLAVMNKKGRIFDKEKESFLELDRIRAIFPSYYNPRQLLVPPSEGKKK